MGKEKIIMNIPKKVGTYDLNVGDKTVHISIQYVSEIMSRLDMIGAGIRDRIAHFKNVPEYNVNVTDANGNSINHLKTTDEDKYISFMSSLVGQENGVTGDPDKLRQNLVFKFQKDTDIYVVESKFGGVVKNKMKFVLYFETWSTKRGDMLTLMK